MTGGRTCGGTRYRVILHGRRSPGRLDAVTGLLAALRRLGHPVLHVDGSVDVASLGPALLRFRPDVLVLLGPAPALTAQSQQLLRDHDVLGVGWQVGGRDLARHAHPQRLGLGLDLLATTGVRAHDARHLHVPPGALRLPVGADRDLLEQPLPPAPGPRHDVLVLGHATGRRDVHELADRLVRELSAVTYGPGWPTAWHGSPDGAHLLQVLRHGRVHVHVTPGAGPLLSVAAGGVLAVPSRGAVAEQVAGLGADAVLLLEGDDDAVEQLSGLLHDPDRAERLRDTARQRLLAAHTYEHRWASLVGELERRASEREGLPDVERAVRVVERARGELRPAPRRILVSGWYGAANTGDDLILEALAHRVEADVPGAQVVVAARYPDPVLAEHGLESFDRTDRRVTEEEAARATTVVLGGGGLWEDYTFVRNHGVAGLVTDAVASVTGLAVLPVLADLHRRPVHVVGVGVGPLTHPGARAVVRHVGDLAESVTVRDERSKADLLAIPGWHTPVEVAPDVVYALDPGPLPHPRVRRDDGRPLVGVNLRPWAEDDPAVAAAVQTLRTVAEERDAVLVGVPLSPQDATRLAAVLPATGADHELLDPVGSDAAQLLADLRECDALVSMRLHGCLLGHRAGTAVVGLGYDPKVAAHFAELGRERFVVPLADAGTALLPLLQEALDVGLPPVVKDAVRDLEERATAALGALTQRLAAVEPPPEPLAALPWLDDDVPGRLTIPCVPGDVAGLSTVSPHRHPRVHAALSNGDLLMGFADRHLRAGDVVSWAGLVPAAGGGSGRRVEVSLASPYLEDPSAVGRLVWQVLAGDRVLVSQDVARWKGDASVWVGWGPTAGDVRLEVRVVALADSTGRHWSRASGLHLRAPVAHAWPDAATLPAGRWVAGCSVPGAAVLT